MQRDPNEKIKADYYKRIKYRTVHPILFWYQCDKCGKEFTREKIYSFEAPYLYRRKITLPSMKIQKYGCKNCFADIDDFKEYCIRYICL